MIAVFGLLLALSGCGLFRSPDRQWSLPIQPKCEPEDIRMIEDRGDTWLVIRRDCFQKMETYRKKLEARAVEHGAVR